MASRRGAIAVGSLALVLAACVHRGAAVPPGPPQRPPGSPCFAEQVRIEDFCVDQYEDYTVELDAHGGEHPHSPYAMIGDARVRAKVARGVVPQAYISQVQARGACEEAGKRLCKPDEYIRACRGPSKKDLYPYGGMQRRPGWCNEGKGSFVALAFGQDFYKLTYAEFNDPKLDQMPGGLARTGAFPKCVSPDGLYDMVGNLHEWVDEEANGHGRFRGGWYGDAENNGPGCFYVTTAHEPTYHDYSTGFRCCADAVAPAPHAGP
ncbi:MAG: SUMF1/EgtB/PvdO family nonheme iron enzyme [Polyangiaceae bacterium]